MTESYQALVELQLLDVALDRPIPSPPQLAVGVQTHTLMMRLLALADEGQPRRTLLREVVRAWRHQGPFAASEDELTRPGDDFLSVLPALYISVRLLLNPRAAASAINRTVERYALTETAAARIRNLL